MTTVENIAYDTLVSQMYEKDTWGTYDAKQGLLALPLGVSDGESVDLEWFNNIAIVGSTGSSKTTILENVLVGLGLLYNPDSLKITLMDCKGNLVNTFTSNSQMLHPLVDTVLSDADRIDDYFYGLNVAQTLRKPLPIPRIIVIDEVSLLSEDALDTLLFVMSKGSSVGLHVVITGQPAPELVTLIGLCSEIIFTGGSAEDFRKYGLGRPYVRLPFKYGMASLCKEQTPDIIEVVRIPTMHWKERQDVLLSLNTK